MQIDNKVHSVKKVSGDIGGDAWNIPCIETSDEEKLCKCPLVSQEDLISTFDITSIDYLFLHQANKFIDAKIRKALKVPAEKVPYCIEDFGNVTSASIPLTMITRAAEALADPLKHCIACGFGVGLAWASMDFRGKGVKMGKHHEF